jgi:hypothetical protein
MVLCNVDVDIEEFADEDLISELEDRGYSVSKGKAILDKEIWDLYQIFITDKGDNNNMDKALRNFFAIYLNKTTV